MTYELAKRLFKAGFPFKSPYVWLIDDGDKTELVSVMKSTKYSRSLTPLPTLSELIGACGDRFLSLARPHDDHNQTAYWEANGMGGEFPQIRHENVSTKGDTPEEAVANLWLKLHES